MSWQAFIDTSLVGTGHITKGAIIGIADKNTWASSLDLSISPKEVEAIINILDQNDTALDAARSGGLYVAGVRYVLARADDMIYARNIEKNGVVIAGAKTCIVVGIHGEAMVAGNATSVVVALKEHLENMGY